jgi:SAM-dependent methyltransferase
MTLTQIRQDFIDRTARKPGGEKAIKAYNEPKAHYKSFRIILERLNLSAEDEYFEIGCGGGVLLSQALERVESAAAIDHSPDMVALSKKNNQRHVEQGRVEIASGDATKLPWADNRFTAGASANMFFFIEQPEAVLREACRVLQPGGRFAMVTMNNSILGKLTFGWLYSLRTYSDENMREMFRSAGFSNIGVKSRWGVMQMCYAEKVCEED